MSLTVVETAPFGLAMWSFIIVEIILTLGLALTIDELDKPLGYPHLQKAGPD